MVVQPRSTARTVVVDGKEWLEVDLAKFRMPLDWNPESGQYLLIAPPAGGIGGFAALAQGERGYAPTIIMSNFEELPSDSVTPGSATLTLLAPGTDAAGPVYGLDLAIRRGTDGEPGAALITPDDYGETPVVGQLLSVASGAAAFELVTPKVVNQHWPASVSSVPGGTTSSPYTMATVSITSGVYNFDYRLQPSGTCQVVGSSSDLRVNLVARYNAVDGPIIGICHGLSGQYDRLTLTPGPAAGSADTVGKVTAGNGALVYFNCERQSGSASYSASNAYGHFSVLVVPA